MVRAGVKAVSEAVKDARTDTAHTLNPKHSISLPFPLRVLSPAARPRKAEQRERKRESVPFVK